MTINSLKKDHDLIEKVLKSMETTLDLLKNGKNIPEAILMEIIDFSKNFTNVCHHGKEEESLFPALEKTGMPKNMGPIAVMLMEHEITKKLSDKLENSVKEYFENDDSTKLQFCIQEYIEHVTQHLWKENNRLFVMAGMRLQGNLDHIEEELNQVEGSKLSKIGKNRIYYESIADKISKELSESG